MHECQKFDAMKEWEKYEINDYMCMQICFQVYHKCFDKEEENDLLGVDVAQIKDDYRNCVDKEKYKCEWCEFTSPEMKDVTQHYLKTHRHNHQIKCWKCDKKVTTILELKKHVGMYHYTPECEV